jgi:hypothetical protein
MFLLRRIPSYSIAKRITACELIGHQIPAEDHLRPNEQTPRAVARQHLGSVGLTRSHDQELWPAGWAALQREIDEMRPRIDGDGMGLGCEECLSELLEALRVLGEDRDVAAFCRDVEPPRGAIVGEHVGGCCPPVRAR